MKIIEHVIDITSRATELSLYALGDLHVGALNCDEQAINKVVGRIAADPNAFWIAGGDMCDAVILSDSKRFDPNVLPRWMLEGGAEKVRMNIKDMLAAQRARLYNLLDPIRDKCIGMIEGNHEYSIMKHHNRDHQSHMCGYFGVEDLTDCAFIRIKIKRKTKNVRAIVQTVRVYAAHGTGGGRTSGAEPNKLYRMAADKECEIVLTGHTHTFFIHPPIPIITCHNNGEALKTYEKHAANWGAYVKTYEPGPSTYGTRAQYPVRPMYTVECKIKPFRQRLTENGKFDYCAIEMNQVKL